MPGVCAVHAVMLGGESPLSRYAWSRRTREAQRCFINRASMHGRYDRLPREASHVPREVACYGNWLRDEESSLTAWRSQ
jgi:hypothetical protein